MKSVFKKIIKTGLLTTLAFATQAQAQGQYPEQLAMGAMTVAGRANSLTDTVIDIYQCADQSVASCRKYTVRPLPLNTQLAVPANSYYRAFVNSKMQEQAIYIRQNDRSVVQLSFLNLTVPPTTSGDVRVTLAAELSTPVQKDSLALDMVSGLKQIKLPAYYEDGPQQSFLDFCVSRTFFVTQEDAPGRPFQFSVTPEIERLCTAVKNGHNLAAAAEMMTFKNNGYISTNAINFEAAFKYSKKPKHISIYEKNVLLYPGLSFEFIYGEPAPKSVGWNVFPGTYYLHWSNEAGQTSIRTVNVQ